MTTALILIASGILIGAGIGVIWRDVRRSRRRAFVLQRDVQATVEPEVEIVISRGDTAVTLSQPMARAAPAAPAANGQAGEAAVAGSAKELAEQPVPGGSLSLEQQWLVLKPILAVAIGSVNGVLAPVKLSIAASGEPAWSYKKTAYGTPRRVMLGEESLGWLRLELTADGRFLATLKAHKDEQAEINGSAETATATLNPAHAGDVLSRCLEPAARYAARAAGVVVDERQASERAWKTVEPLVLAALKATNGALAQAGARLVPLGAPGWTDEVKRHRMALSLEVGGGPAGRMHIERVAHDMEVAVGVGDQRLIEFGRRRRIPVDNMTIHALAELIAACAWPTIAHLRETRPQADR
jgi:pyruvate/2-oxoglutarate dehydrogenase complex dihydrolipoamide acyltransferase (E2) component